MPIKRASTPSETLALSLNLSATRLPEPELEAPPVLPATVMNFGEPRPSLDPLLCQLIYLDLAHLSDTGSTFLVHQSIKIVYDRISLSAASTPATNCPRTRTPWPCRLRHQTRLFTLNLLVWMPLPRSFHAHRVPPCSAHHRHTT
jgi:hypothetical protein